MRWGGKGILGSDNDSGEGEREVGGGRRVREVVRTVAAGAWRKEVESESIMVGGLLLPSCAAMTVSLPFVAAGRVKPMQGVGVKVTDKGQGRREGGGQGTDSPDGLNGCCSF
jgi:hypothetical protein